MNYVLPIALKFGLGYILSKFPGLPQQVKDIIIKALEELSEHKAERGAIRAKAVNKAKKCVGSMCMPEVKK